MKSRRKSSKRTQSGLDGSQLLALKQQDSTTSSTAHSQESTKSETIGQTPTKNCIECGVVLNTETNWWPSFKEKKHYKCKDCYNIRREENKKKKESLNAEQVTDSTPKENIPWGGVFFVIAALALAVLFKIAGL